MTARFHPKWQKRTAIRLSALPERVEAAPVEPVVVVDVEGGIGINGSETRLEREVPDSQRPICVPCTRAARTCDTPSVRVRVDRCRLLRDAAQRYWLVSECHGDREAVEVKLDGIEELIERVEVFRGD